MKKLKLGIVSAALFLAAGGVSAVLSSNGELLKVNAASVSDAGELLLTIDSNLPQNSYSFYMTATKGDANILPDDWNNGYAPVSGEGSFKINNVESSYFTVKKTDPGRFYFETSGASAGDELYLGGKWSRIDTSTDTEYQFTFSPAITFTYNGSSWDYVLEDYDRVSLLDAGMPNFEYTAIDNEYGLDNYDNTRLNHFSVNNNTNSYVFEFEVEAKAKEDSQFNLRLGAKTNNWGLDHTIKLNMNGTWGTNGVMEMYEEVEETPTKLRDFDINIAPGSKHTLGIGIVKVKNSTGHLLFVESDGAVVGKIFCKLNEREMGTRAAFYYTGSNYAIRNTIEQEYGEEMLTPSSNPDFTDQNYYRYFYTKTDLIPELNSWIDYGMCYDPSNITLNGNPIFAADAINYMKKVDTTTYFINLPDKSTFKVGDVLTIGGSFKFMQDNSIYHDKDGNPTSRGGTLITPNYIARKVSFKQESFTWDGEKFILKSEYDAAESAKTWAQEFLAENCTATKNGWSAAATSYAALSDEAKALFVAEAHVAHDVEVESYVAKSVQRYDYIIELYGTSTYNDFMGRISAGKLVLTPNDRNVSLETVIQNNGLAIITSAVILLAISAVTGYFVIRKKQK